MVGMAQLRRPRSTYPLELGGHTCHNCSRTFCPAARSRRRCTRILVGTCSHSMSVVAPGSDQSHGTPPLGSLRRAAPRAPVRAVGESGREGMEVLCERCAVHGAARCGWIYGSRKLRRGRRGEGPCEGTGSGRQGPARAVFVGALRLELVGACSAARAALLRCEPPRSPGRVRGVRACKRRAARRGRGAHRNVAPLHAPLE